MIKWQNLKINIQYPSQSVRRGVDKDGNSWSQRMPFDYGEIVGTKGVDKEPVDVILGNHLTSSTVYICQLPKAKSGEDKCMIGFLTQAAAKKAFLSCYGGDISFFKAIRGVTVKKFLKLLISRKGLSLSAGFYDSDWTTTLGILQPIPTSWNTKVENPGDRKLTKDEQDFNTELARHQGPEKAYVQTVQVADTTSHVDGIYSNKGASK